MKIVNLTIIVFLFGIIHPQNAYYKNSLICTDLSKDSESEIVLNVFYDANVHVLSFVKEGENGSFGELDESSAYSINFKHLEQFMFNKSELNTFLTNFENGVHISGIHSNGFLHRTPISCTSEYH
jgi:hypothetical protein